MTNTADTDLPPQSSSSQAEENEEEEAKKGRAQTIPTEESQPKPRILRGKSIRGSLGKSLRAVALTIVHDESNEKVNQMEVRTDLNEQEADPLLRQENEELRKRNNQLEEEVQDLKDRLVGVMFSSTRFANVEDQQA